jgi:hypothetical protein
MDEEPRIRRSTRQNVRSRQRPVLKSVSRRRQGVEEENRDVPSEQQDTPAPPKRPDVKEEDNSSGLLKPDEDDDFQPFLRRSSASVGKMQRPRVMTRPKAMSRPQARSRHAQEDQEDKKPEEEMDVPRETVVTPPKLTHEEIKENKPEHNITLKTNDDDDDGDLKPFMRRSLATVEKMERPRMKTRPRLQPRPQARTRQTTNMQDDEDHSIPPSSTQPTIPSDSHNMKDVNMDDTSESASLSRNERSAVLPSLQDVSPTEGMSTGFEQSVQPATEIQAQFGTQEPTEPPLPLERSANDESNDTLKPQHLTDKEDRSMHVTNESGLDILNATRKAEGTRISQQPMETPQIDQQQQQQQQEYADLSTFSEGRKSPTVVSSTTLPTEDKEHGITHKMGLNEKGELEDKQTMEVPLESSSGEPFTMCKLDESTGFNQESHSSESIHQQTQCDDVMEKIPGKITEGVVRDISRTAELDVTMIKEDVLDTFSETVAMESVSEQSQPLSPSQQGQRHEGDNPVFKSVDVSLDSPRSQEIQQKSESPLPSSTEHVDIETFNMETQQEVSVAAQEVDVKEEVLTQEAAAKHEVKTQEVDVKQEVTSQDTTTLLMEELSQSKSQVSTEVKEFRHRRVSPSFYSRNQRRRQSSTSDHEDESRNPQEVPPPKQLHSVQENKNEESLPSSAHPKAPPSASPRRPVRSIPSRKPAVPPPDFSGDHNVAMETGSSQVEFVVPSRRSGVITMDTSQSTAVTMETDKPETLDTISTSHHSSAHQSTPTKPSGTVDPETQVLAAKMEVETKQEHSTPEQSKTDTKTLDDSVDSEEIGIRRSSRTVSVVDKSKLPKRRGRARIQDDEPAVATTEAKDEDSQAKDIWSKSKTLETEKGIVGGQFTESDSNRREFPISQVTPEPIANDTAPVPTPTPLDTSNHVSSETKADLEKDNLSHSLELQNNKEPSPLPSVDDSVDISSFNLSLRDTPTPSRVETPPTVMETPPPVFSIETSPTVEPPPTVSRIETPPTKDSSMSKFFKRAKSPPIDVPTSASMVSATESSEVATEKKPTDEDQVEKDNSQEADNQNQVGIRRSTRLSSGEKSYIHSRRLRRGRDPESEKKSHTSGDTGVVSTSKGKLESENTNKEKNKQPSQPQQIKLFPPADEPETTPSKDKEGSEENSSEDLQPMRIGRSSRVQSIQSRPRLSTSRRAHEVATETAKDDKSEVKSSTLGEELSPRPSSLREAETGQKMKKQSVIVSASSSASEPSPDVTSRRRTAVMRKKTTSRPSVSSTRRTRKFHFSSSEDEEDTGKDDVMELADPFRSVSVHLLVLVGMCMYVYIV